MLRILGVALAGLWFTAFGLVLTGYRPGGPVDLVVGFAAIGPVAIALVAVARPPVARGDRAFASIVWLGLGAVLLLVPSLGGIATQLAGGGPQTLLPSVEAGYPWLLALLATGLFAGFGVARRRLGEAALRRRRLRLGAAIGIALTVLAGGTFTVAAVANELALRDHPSSASRFGPTDPDVEPPRCSDPLAVGSTARLDLRMDDAVDDRRTGQAVIDGIRDGADVRWTGFAATRLTLGQHGLVRVGDRAWAMQPGVAWTSVPAEVAAGHDLDRQLVAVALTPGNRAVAEDRGLEIIEGARARHCRVTIDGTTLRLALPMVDLLVGASDLSIWRGELDFWVFADGQLGQADGRVTGPALGIEEGALIAELRFRLTAVDRGLPISVMPPAR